MGSLISAIVTGRLLEAPGSPGGMTRIVVFVVGRKDGPGERMGAEPGSKQCSKGSQESRFRTACRGLSGPGGCLGVVQSARDNAERTKPRHAGIACRGLLFGAIECVRRGWRDYVSLSLPVGAQLLGSVKEVIQPQVPLRLPCYDFAPVTALAFGRLIP